MDNLCSLIDSLYEYTEAAEILAVIKSDPEFASNHDWVPEESNSIPIEFPKNDRFVLSVLFIPNYFKEAVLSFWF